jgi:tyrosinase
MSGQSAPLVRRNVWTLPSGDTTIADYAKAVAIMKSRNASDPTSWTYQAAMHGTHATQTKPLWNGCQHGSWWFLPWHRMFLYYFERIVRAAVVQAGGNPNWTLPYWNYGVGGQQATIPTAFRNPTTGGQPNPLYVQQRAPGINSGMALPSAVTTDQFALSRPQYPGVPQFGGGVASAQQFAGQYGQVEQTPHNDVHGVVGGQSGWMNDPDQAAQDPIFWLHHSNIDRIWSEWLNTGGHKNPQTSNWLNQQFSFFDEHGHQVTKACRDVRLIMHQLGYIYETAPVGTASVGGVEPPEEEAAMADDSGSEQEQPVPQPEMVGASEQTVRLVGSPADVEVQIDPQAHAAVVGDAGGQPNHIYLNVEDIEGQQNPGTVYGIYVDLPPDASPQTAAEYHVGNVSFFGIERALHPRGDAQPHPLRVSVEITELVSRLRSEGSWDPQHVSVTFRPLGLVPPDQPELAHALPDSVSTTDPPVTIGRVSLSYE